MSSTVVRASSSDEPSGRGIPALTTLPSTWEDVIAATIVIVGIVFRAIQYLGNRSLWGDEVAIAINLKTRGFSGLLHPLSYDQTMPLGLLLMLKANALALGFSELALRLPLFLAGVVLLILAWVLLSKVFEPRVALLTLGLLAVSQPLIYYSAELKQYGLDAVVTLILVWLGVVLLRSTRDEIWRRMILIGSLALLFSQPSIFILASIGLAAVFDSRFWTSPRWRTYTLVAGACWVSIFGVLYWFSYRTTSHSAFMQAFWSDSFIVLRRPDFSKSLSQAMFFLSGAPHIAHARVSVLGCAFLGGIYGIWKKYGIPIAILVAGPFGFVLLAGFFGRYPFAVRLLLFAVAPLFLILASAVSWFADFLPARYSLPAFVALSCLLVAPTFFSTLRASRHFNQREATRDLAQKVESSHDNAPVYLVFGRYTQWGYYAGDWRDHPEIWKGRVDAAYKCMISAELGYFGGAGRTPECSDITFPAYDGRPEELVGDPPPGPEEGSVAEERWSETEARRIASVRAQSVWLFLPIYVDHAIAGFPKRRKLLEKLESQLQADGCRVVETDSQGESLAQRYRCPAPGGF